MSLPPIFLFEDHRDPASVQVAYELLPKLKELGYQTLALELPHEFSLEKIDACVKRLIEECKIAQKWVKEAAKKFEIPEESLAQKKGVEIYALLQRFLKPNEAAIHSVYNRFLRLESSEQMLKLISLAKKIGFSIIGTDANEQCLKIFGKDPLTTIGQRDEIMAGHLKKLRSKGVVNICGYLHAPQLTTALPDALNYYLRSPQSLDREEKMPSPACLKEATYTISEKEIPSFVERIVARIKTPFGYIKECPEGNSQSKYLSQVFGVPCQVFMRPEYYADALLKKESVSNISAIEARLAKANIQTATVKILATEYLAIRGINVKAVAVKIFKLSSN